MILRTAALAILAMGLFASCSKKASDPSPNQASELPTVETDSAGSLTKSSAKIYARILSEGSSAVISAGVAWGTSPNPTVFENNAPSSGFGVGSFALNITGLSKNITYHARAYATNAKGTQYGKDISFTTTNPPILSDTLSLITKSWKLIEAKSNPGIQYNGITYTDIYNSPVIANCEKDNILTFKTNSDYSIDGGAVKCNTGEAQTIESGRWTYESTSNSLTLIPQSSPSSKSKILLISSSQLKLEINDSDLNRTFTFTYQAQ